MEAYLLNSSYGLARVTLIANGLLWVLLCIVLIVHRSSLLDRSNHASKDQTEKALGAPRARARLLSSVQLTEVLLFVDIQYYALFARLQLRDWEGVESVGESARARAFRAYMKMRRQCHLRCACSVRGEAGPLSQTVQHRHGRISSAPGRAKNNPIRQWVREVR